MPAKKKSVTTPLHLLQQLSDTLIEHLDKACQLALKDAEGTLAKLEKQRGKTQDKLSKARSKLEEAAGAGRAKAQSKARARITELEELMALMQGRQGEMLGYIAELKRDIAQSMHLAQGVRRVGEDAGKALLVRNKGGAAGATKTASVAKPTTRSARATPATAKPAAKSAAAPASKAPASVKKPATKPSASPAPAAKPAQSKPAVAPKVATTSKPAAAKKPVARKPASSPANQAPLSSS